MQLDSLDSRILGNGTDYLTRETLRLDRLDGTRGWIAKTDLRCSADERARFSGALDRCDRLHEILDRFGSMRGGDHPRPAVPASSAVLGV